MFFRTGHDLVHVCRPHILHIDQHGEPGISGPRAMTDSPHWHVQLGSEHFTELASDPVLIHLPILHRSLAAASQAIFENDSSGNRCPDAQIIQQDRRDGRSDFSGLHSLRWPDMIAKR